MKVLNKIKSIYLLAIVALLSFCMLLFPAMPKTASADGTMGTGNIDIKSAKVVVQTYKGQDGNDYDKWAIMFKAEIGQEQYNAITDEDTADVKFGMLIGPTNFLNDATDYAGLITNKFVSISYVGSVAGEGIQKLEFTEGKAEYWGAIVYDEAKLADEKGPASMELTAVPFYTDGTTNVALLAQKKSATPRNILVESYLQQQDGAVVIDGVPIKESTIGTFAGELDYATGDYYVCRSTNRLMAGKKQGELAPTNLVEDATDLVVMGKTRTTTTATELFDAEKLASLPKYGKVNFVDYTAEGIKVYKADVAERVIMRFADTTVGTTATNTTADYLAKMESSAYKSIFYTTYNWEDGSVIWVLPNVNHDGLYVLGDNLLIPSSHNYNVISASAYNNLYYRIGSRKGGDGYYYGAGVSMSPVVNGGFTGIFDGRGFKIDLSKKALHGVFPAMYGATIKNVAMLNLYNSYEWGGITNAAKNSIFKNVYATVTSIGNGTSDNENPIAMALENCSLTNVVIEASAVTNAVMTKSLGAPAFGMNNSGHGQGRVTGGVFSFVKFPDSFVDSTGTAVRVANPSLSTQMAPFLTEEAEKLFGKKFTDSNVRTIRQFAYGVDEKDAFLGTTATNVYAVGTSPLFINYCLSPENDQKNSGDYYVYNAASFKPTNKAVVFVNDALQFNSDILGDDGETIGQTEVLNTNTTDFYKISSLIDTNGLFTVDANDGIWTLAEIIRKGKEYRCGKDNVANMLATPETSEFEVRLITNPGFHDVANATEMKAHVLAQEIPFDSAYWNVGADGSVSWAK